MKRFSEMNQTVVGAVGLTMTVLISVAAIEYDKLPLFNAGDRYTAIFTEVGQLKSGDPVQAYGVEVGEVEKISLDEPVVKVKFKISDGDVDPGAETTAEIKTLTALGRQYLEVVPRGDGKLDDPIPLERTTPPYQLTEVLGQLTTTVRDIDTGRLSTALNTLSDTLRDTPPELSAALDGVSRLTATLNSRDDALGDLLTNAEGVTGVLSDRNVQLQRLLIDGNALLAELESRRRDIHGLLVNVNVVAGQLRGLVADNQAQLQPTLDKLNTVLDLLKRNEDNVTQAVAGLEGYGTSLGEAVASGPFFTAYVQNLIPGNVIRPYLAGAFADVLGQPPAPPIETPGAPPPAGGGR